MTIREYADSMRIPPAKLLNELQIKFPDRNLKLTSELPAEFATAAKEYVGDDENDDTPIGAVGESAITTADEAVAKASYSLIEADQLNLEQSAEVHVTQASVAGAVAGVESAIAFTQALVNARQNVTDMITEATMQGTERLIDRSEQTTIRFAQTAGECLGKSVRRKQEIQEQAERLKARVSMLTSKIKRY